MVRNFEPCAGTEWMHCQEQGIRKVIGTRKKTNECYGEIIKKRYGNKTNIWCHKEDAVVILDVHVTPQKKPAKGWHVVPHRWCRPWLSTCGSHPWIPPLDSMTPAASATDRQRPTWMCW